MFHITQQWYTTIHQFSNQIQHCLSELSPTVDYIDKAAIVSQIPQSVEKSKQHHIVGWKIWVLVRAAANTTWPGGDNN